MRDKEFMTLALAQARQGLAAGEVPIGAVVVFQGTVIAEATNTRERLQDPLGHAELTALRAAALAIGRWRLAGCSLFVTLEPCPMCLGAAAWSRLDRIIFGAYDLHLGACGSAWSLAENPAWNHRMQIVGGICDQACESLLDDFFATRRREVRPSQA